MVPANRTARSAFQNSQQTQVTCRHVLTIANKRTCALPSLLPSVTLVGTERWPAVGASFLSLRALVAAPLLIFFSLSTLLPALCQDIRLEEFGCLVRFDLE
jgi:hypothetical protein